MTQVVLLNDEEIVLHAAAANFPVPNAAGLGGSLATWRKTRLGLHSGERLFGHSDIDIELTANIACDMDGPLAVYRERDDGRIAFVALLNGGAPIKIQKNGAGPVIGHCQIIQAAALGARLIVGGYGGTVTPVPAANVIVKVTPIDSL